MAELVTEVRKPSMNALRNEPAAPPYLSSAGADWEGLSVEVFHKTRERESWRVPATTDITLVLCVEGAMHTEQRQVQGHWEGRNMYAGDFLLHWGGSQPYEIRWWSLSTAPTQTLALHLSRELVNRVAQEVAGADLTSLALVGRASFRDPLLTQIALALWRELEQPTPAGKLYAQIAAQLISVHLVLRFTSSRSLLRAAPSVLQGLTDRQITQVLDFVLTHLNEDLSWERLARQIGFSPCHFARLFRKTMGASLHQVVLHQRIECAQRLLRETDMPLAQVASTCGFAHQSHLTRVFRKHLGITPRAYRRAGLSCPAF
jgi:AraC family transcriptional regulator